MDRRCPVHELVERKGINLGDFRFLPVVTDGGRDSSHGSGVFIDIVGIALTVVVGMTDGLLMKRG